MGRDFVRCRLRMPPWISTHTPAWGVTVCTVDFFVHRHNFNSHARVGRDLVSTDNTPASSAISTHTPAWGVTTAGLLHFGGRRNFNSHARVGRDIVPHHVKPPLNISTHTPAWGVTVFDAISKYITPISTHTPAWGVTMYLAKKLIWTQFQLTRPRGA